MQPLPLLSEEERSFLEGLLKTLEGMRRNLDRQIAEIKKRLQ
jgi:hypothetical protein